MQGGRPGGYPGQNAGGIDVSNAAYCWVKDVQIDGTTSGMPIRLAGTYRCVVRDSHFHNSYSYGFAQDNYGIVLACGAADNLVENNIVRFMNKPILFNNSGGGNVVGYNYADNSWSCDGNNDDGFQEVNIDCHCAFPHMELMEGNWAPHMGATTTHGNAGYLTYFRNYASSQWSPSSRPGDVGHRLEPAVRPAVRERRRARVRQPGCRDDGHRQRAREHGRREPGPAGESRDDEQPNDGGGPRQVYTRRGRPGERRDLPRRPDERLLDEPWLTATSTPSTRR